MHPVHYCKYVTYKKIRLRKAQFDLWYLIRRNPNWKKEILGF